MTKSKIGFSLRRKSDNLTLLISNFHKEKDKEKEIGFSVRRKSDNLTLLVSIIPSCSCSDLEDLLAELGSRALSCMPHELDMKISDQLHDDYWMPLSPFIDDDDRAKGAWVKI